MNNIKGTVEKELTGDVNPNYLFLSKMQNLILHVYKNNLTWDQDAVMELGFRFISRNAYIKLYSNNNPQMKVDTFDFMPQYFFILAIPSTAQVNGHSVVIEGGIEFMLYTENIIYCYESILDLDDAIQNKGLSDHAKYIIFNPIIYSSEDFVSIGFENKIEWMLQNG
jgi:hypothetical protein